MPRQVAFYGKGGIGKSTVVANVTASLAVRGHRVLQVGCDPKRDSSRTLLGGKSQVAVLDLLRNASSPGRKAYQEITVDQMMKEGFAGVQTIEAGGPEPGFGCAGRGITMTIEVMTQKGVFERGWDYVFYDVLGDVVCGGFAVPIRDSYAEEVYLVVSGEFMALYAANNICKGVARFAERGATRVAGVVANERKVKGEREIIEAFAERIGTRLIQFVPRDPVVQAAENARKTVVEFAPDSDMAEVYADLAAKIEARPEAVIPAPMEDEELEEMFALAKSGDAPRARPPRARPPRAAAGRVPSPPARRSTGPRFPSRNLPEPVPIAPEARAHEPAPASRAWRDAEEVAG